MNGEMFDGDEYSSPDGTLADKATYWDGIIANIDPSSKDHPALLLAFEDMVEALSDKCFDVNTPCFVSGRAVWAVPAGETTIIQSTDATSTEYDGVTVYKGNVTLSGAPLRSISIAQYGESEGLSVWFTFAIGEQELETTTLMYSDKREYLLHVQASTAQLLDTEYLDEVFEKDSKALSEKLQSTCDDDLRVLSYEFNEHEEDHYYKLLPIDRQETCDWDFVQYAEKEVPVRNVYAAIHAKHALVAVTGEQGPVYKQIDIGDVVLNGLCLALQPVDKRFIPFVDYSMLNPRELCLTTELQVDLEQGEEVVLPAKTIVHLPLFSQKVAILPRS